MFVALMVGTFNAINLKVNLTVNLAKGGIVKHTKAQFPDLKQNFDDFAVNGTPGKKEMDVVEQGLNGFDSARSDGRKQSEGNSSI